MRVRRVRTAMLVYLPFLPQRILGAVRSWEEVFRLKRRVRFEIEELDNVLDTYAAAGRTACRSIQTATER